MNSFSIFFLGGALHSDYYVIWWGFHAIIFVVVFEYTLALRSLK